VLRHYSTPSGQQLALVLLVLLLPRRLAAVLLSHSTPHRQQLLLRVLPLLLLLLGAVRLSHPALPVATAARTAPSSCPTTSRQH
jgi:hypothetical protein